ncbi:NADPH-dependent F420 reductase [Hyphomicrobium sp.]|uniref:NADPH-dependent F420 reductase n=1 Tax=Hyphomicrobium sp. TaxID=82 RepID=UPI001DD28A4B|nr:NADPH-dependent F420 reductase [Hyphomicrobium sp.]MBY0558774.1 NADPH-dependent F420 reductase [Hyphomicrobium sp.]
MTRTIGLIGTGMIGTTLARLAIAAGIDVLLSNSRGPESLRGLVADLGPRATASTVADAAVTGDIVIAAIPMSAYRSLQGDLLKGKIVIDTMNYYPTGDDHIPILDEAKLTSSELVQQHIKGSTVVKALFNLDFHHLLTNARPHRHPERTTLPIAGDDEEAKSIVAGFMDEIGFDALDTGTLAASWRIEPDTPIYVWPYVPSMPDHLSGEDRKKWYCEHAGNPVTRETAQNLVDEAIRRLPAGGLPERLPPEHLDLVAQIFASRSLVQ